MATVSNDPTWWPIIDAYRLRSYFGVAAFVVVTYDWALTFGQEVELIWRQRWSLMTVMYLSCCANHLPLITSLLILVTVPTISSTDMQCWIVYIVWDWIGVVVFAMLWVIIIARLHAMYQRSRKIQIFLIVTFLAINAFDAVVAIMTAMDASGKELVLSGNYQCQVSYSKDISLLFPIAWILSTVWEVLVLCLAVWIVVRHFRELRQHSAEGIIEHCFTVLMKTHVLYFVSFVAVSCFSLIVYFYPTFLTSDSLAPQIVSGVLQILTVVQMSVLGPRLILGVREYHAKLVVDSDAATGMTSIAFQERVEISTGNGV